MMVVTGMIALGESFRDMTGGVQVLDALENQFRQLGATHFLATGLPLPGRTLEPLILRVHWGDMRHDRNGMTSVKADDALLRAVLGGHRSFLGKDKLEKLANAESSLLADLDNDLRARLVAIPICAFLPYQAAVLATGPELHIDTRILAFLELLCIEAFRRLMALGFIRPERQGDLSARERRVVELSAAGKTASEIAAILEISQRTVHAHLQNASEKLRAHNKTHTVVEALRYGQITV
jgi:DNA-binding CsgD family transcriptional regulator